MSVFVDTSAFYAAADRGDTNHEAAIEALSIADGLLLTDHILLETWTLLRHRIGLFAAERFWAGIRSGAANVEIVGTADLETAWVIGLDFADHDFSIVDRTSFAVMQRVGVLRAISYDDDFAIFRFGPRRDRVFEVLR